MWPNDDLEFSPREAAAWRTAKEQEELFLKRYNDQKSAATPKSSWLTSAGKKALLNDLKPSVPFRDEDIDAVLTAALEKMGVEKEQIVSVREKVQERHNLKGDQ